ncbi:hypothetical protein [Sphingomonas abietis]|uniref:Lipoprotein n=1 Tax=Sphingomonas abietis TaxID=3012344 RepID=A0ABY7NP90_9SPHN|nr:hypothetical protein [Sphingomonas abietis]WBO23027.1 hypothetical protein PBT88_02495 [Sphingomonas abietis]
MRRIFALSLLALPLLAGCGQKTEGDAVRQAYDNKADQIDRQAANQSTPTAREIYKDQADSFREEGKDREKGLEGRTPSRGHDGGPTAGGAAPASGQ